MFTTCREYPGVNYPSQLLDNATFSPEQQHTSFGGGHDSLLGLFDRRRFDCHSSQYCRMGNDARHHGRHLWVTQFWATTVDKEPKIDSGEMQDDGFTSSYPLL
jgi:hypothetical protein